jgi:hypothetical protein
MATIKMRTLLATISGGRQEFVRLCFLSVFVFFSFTLKAQDFGLYWKFKDYDGAVAVSAPGWLAKIGSLFIDEDEGRQLVRKINKVRVLVFQDGSPLTAKDFTRFRRKAEKRHLDELLTIREGKNRVQIYGKMRRNKIKKVVVMFDTPDDGSGMLSLKGRFRLEDVTKAFNKMGKKPKNGDKPVVPPVLNVPVIRA